MPKDLCFKYTQVFKSYFQFVFKGNKVPGIEYIKE